MKWAAPDLRAWVDAVRLAIEITKTLKGLQERLTDAVSKTEDGQTVAVSIAFTAAQSITVGNAIGLTLTSTGAGGSTGYVTGNSAIPAAADVRLGYFLAGAAGNAGGMTVHSEEAWSGSARGAYVDIETIAAGTTSRSRKVRFPSKGGIVISAGSALATTATDGFAYVPSCAGPPTGTPTAYTGTVPLVIDSTNNRAYIYSGGAWVALN